MDLASAKRKHAALVRMTVSNGCTPAEAATASALASQLAARFDLPMSVDTEASFMAAERTAALRWGWEYRKCGKASCWCGEAPRGGGHGPYRYARVRRGALVTSVYGGKEPTAEP